MESALAPTSRCVIQFWANIPEDDGLHFVTVEVSVVGMHDVDFLHPRT